VHPPQMFNRRPLWNAWSYGTEKNVVKVIFNVIISIQSFIQIHTSVQKLHHLRSYKVRYFGVIDFTLVSSHPYKISNKSTNHFKRYKRVLFTHLRSLNVCHFGIKLRD
jgi:hypothetical protein